MHEDLHAKIRAGINKLADAVTATMGPDGKTVIIYGDDGEPYVTKDGVSVAKAITLKDPVENIAATLIKEVAKKTVTDAGDGTTTSICLARAFITTGYSLLKKGMSYNDVKRNLEELLEETIHLLKQNSKVISKEDIIHVANIACNNDMMMANTIDKAFHHSHIVKVEKNNSFSDETEVINGMQLNTTYFDTSFINVGDKRSIEYNNASLIILDGKLEDLKPIAKLISQAQTVIIMAEHFNRSVVSILKDNYNRGALNVALIKSPGFAEHRRNLLDDIALYTGAEVLSPNKVHSNGSVMGSIKDITVTPTKTTITTDNINDKVKEKRQELLTIISSLPEGHDKDLVEQRLTNLIGKLAIIKVGGNSEIEMKERYDRYEDAVRAVQCAIEEGIVEGGGMALLKIALHLKNPFADCLYEPHKTIFTKGKVLEVDLGRNMMSENIIDPLKVTRCALENAVSVTKTILSTEAVVLNEHQWN